MRGHGGQRGRRVCGPAHREACYADGVIHALPANDIDAHSRRGVSVSYRAASLHTVMLGFNSRFVHDADRAVRA